MLFLKCFLKKIIITNSYWKYVCTSIPDRIQVNTSRIDKKVLP